MDLRNEQKITELYNTYLGRTPDSTELYYFKKVLSIDATEKDIINAFQGSSEFKHKHDTIKQSHSISSIDSLDSSEICESISHDVVMCQKYMNQNKCYIEISDLTNLLELNLENKNLIILNGIFKTIICVLIFYRIEDNSLIFFNDFRRKKKNKMLLRFYKIVESGENAVVLIKRKLHEIDELDLRKRIMLTSSIV